MKLLNTDQIREWDCYSILHKPISSIDLMENAACASTDWILRHIEKHIIYIFCGQGNNGGDGLAIARFLSLTGKLVKVFVLSINKDGSPDFNTNLERLKSIPSVEIVSLESEESFPLIPQGTIIIDALFGTGLNRKLEGIAATLIQQINESKAEIISIDLPSGLLCDESSIGFPVVEASHTLSFQIPKLALLLPENEIHFGQVHILDIGLLPAFLDIVETKFEWVNETLIQQIYRPRKPFAHKGNYGHALLIAGSYGKMGAAVLSTKTCLKSGAGLVSVHVPKCGLDIVQISAPEAMCQVDEEEKIISAIHYDLSSFKAVGIGPGIGNEYKTATFLKELICQYNNPMVLDADAINILSENPDWLTLLPPQSILTPHVKEFVRLFGEGLNDFEKLEMALQKAMAYQIIIVLKGHRTFIASPSGKGYFNSTGNAGMATGGSGDVLTGIITGILAQGYPPDHAAILGVYLHGKAGDKAAARYGMDAMLAGDIIGGLGFE